MGGGGRETVTENVKIKRSADIYKKIIIFKNIHVCIKRFQRAVANKYAQQNHNNAKLFDV